MTMIVIGQILGKPLSPGGREGTQEEGVVGAESWVRPPTPLLTSTIHHHQKPDLPPPPPQNRTIHHHHHSKPPHKNPLLTSTIHHQHTKPDHPQPPPHKTGPTSSDFESDDYGSGADFDDEHTGYDDDDDDYEGNGVAETLMQ